MTSLRRIQPMLLPETKRPPVSGKRPELRWVAPTDLFVDDNYQRNLTRTSVRLIRKIVTEFAWSRIKPPVSVRVDGGYHVIDGQHTAIAAASLGLEEMPIFVVDAAEISERAQAFVSHNRNRIAISRLDIHRALVSGGDPLARSIEWSCKEVGVRMRYLVYGEKVDVGDTQSISHVQTLFRQHGVPHAKATLRVLVAGKCAPITEPQIGAASALLLNGVPASRLTMAVRVDTAGDLIKARALAATDGMRAWQALKVIWEKRMRLSGGGGGGGGDGQ